MIIQPPIEGHHVANLVDEWLTVEEGALMSVVRLNTHAYISPDFD
jgi:hypothetical protein